MKIGERCGGRRKDRGVTQNGICGGQAPPRAQAPADAGGLGSGCGNGVLALEANGSWVDVDLAQPDTAPNVVAALFIPETQFSAALVYRTELPFASFTLRAEYSFEDEIGYDANVHHTEVQGNKALPTLQDPSMSVEKRRSR